MDINKFLNSQSYFNEFPSAPQLRGCRQHDEQQQLRADQKKKRVAATGYLQIDTVERHLSIRREKKGRGRGEENKAEERGLDT